MRCVDLPAAFASLAIFAGCAPSGDTAGRDCARVVQQFQGLPSAVRVMEEMETEDGRVEISYESVDGENLPVIGSATCNFAVVGAGSLELVAAVVDGEELDEGELTAVNRALMKKR